MFEYTNSLVNADSFYANFTNTTFQKNPSFLVLREFLNLRVNLPCPKGEKIGHLWQPYLQVLGKLYETPQLTGCRRRGNWPAHQAVHTCASLYSIKLIGLTLKQKIHFVFTQLLYQNIIPNIMTYKPKGWENWPPLAAIFASIRGKFYETPQLTGCRRGGNWPARRAVHTCAAVCYSPLIPFLKWLVVWLCGALALLQYIGFDRATVSIHF